MSDFETINFWDMAKNNQFNLDGFERNPDNTYSKIKTTPQPREVRSVYGNPPRKDVEYSFGKDKVVVQEFQPFKSLRTIKLTLFGEPMPKQSVRAYATGKRNKNGILIVDTYQPQKTIDRKKDYQRQIQEQLPKDFTPFKEAVHITKLHFIFGPLKEFHKTKGKMDDIRNGKVFFKKTRPDLDNLQKLTLDSLTGYVFEDDSIICSISDMKKYYGIGGCIIIEMEGH